MLHMELMLRTTITSPQGTAHSCHTTRTLVDHGEEIVQVNVAVYITGVPDNGAPHGRAGYKRIYYDRKRD